MQYCPSDQTDQKGVKKWLESTEDLYLATIPSQYLYNNTGKKPGSVQPHLIKVLLQCTNTGVLYLFESVSQLAKELKLERRTLNNRVQSLLLDREVFISHYKLVKAEVPQKDLEKLQLSFSLPRKMVHWKDAPLNVHKLPLEYKLPQKHLPILTIEPAKVYNYKQIV